MTKFKDRQMEAVYNLYRSTPPAHRGSGIAIAYHLGLDRPNSPGRFVRNSMAYAAWAAGRDTARAAEKSKTN